MTKMAPEVLNAIYPVAVAVCPDGFDRGCYDDFAYVSTCYLTDRGSYDETFNNVEFFRARR